MKNKVKKFKEGKMNVDELVNFKNEVESMTDEELDSYLESCEPDFTFTHSDIMNMQEKLEKDINLNKRHIIFHRFLIGCVAVMLPVVFVCSILLINDYGKLGRYDSIISQEIAIETDNGESLITVLPDGSKISMGPKSSLSYKLASFNTFERHVKYYGEGHFAVAKKSDAPFILSLSNFEIKVLGTEFSLFSRKEKENSEIYLENGSIQLTSFQSKNQRILKPGETAVVCNKTGEIEIYKGKRKSTAGQAMIYFSSSSIMDVAKDLELYYGKKFLVGKDLERLSFTGSLPTDNFNQAIYILEKTLSISILTDETGNTVTFLPLNQ